jgi:hypothetical protein
MWWWRRRSRAGDDVRPAELGPVPRPSARTLAEDWLRTLTVSGEPGITPQQAIELINQVNQPGSPQVRLRTPLSAEDARVLDVVQAWNADVRSRQAGVHLLIEGTLIDWLAEATGQERAAVVERLALRIERVLPPA